MKKTLLFLIALLMAGMASAQNPATQTRDSLVYRPAATVDSTLTGKSIFNLMPSKAKGAKADVKVNQSQAIIDGVRKHVASNPSRTMSGYRVRIYFDNSQNSRGASEAALNRFVALHHGIPAYRSYQNPFFKVTVGDFRTKSEAMELLQKIKNEFPTAFVLKENINYPPADRQRTYIVDTVRVTRPVAR